MRYVLSSQLSNRMFLSRPPQFLFAILLTLQLVACGGGDDGGSSITSTTTSDALAANVATDVVLGGSVGDGPVTGARVAVYNSSGQLVGTMVSDNSASFNATFRVKGNEYPLLLKVGGGIDLVTGMAPDFQMLSVMLKPSDKQVNINPFSTLIVKIAQSLPGGLNDRNVATAKGFVTSRLGFGLDLNLLADPVTSTVTDSNVANLVKASEALGELVRRTRDLIAATGAAISGDGVVAALAADMVDGYLDGLGAPGTRPTVTAVANVVSGQVLVEALSNNLRVNGVIATGIIDQSIAITRPQIRTAQLTDNVRITQGMLDQTRAVLAAARVLDTSTSVANIAKTVDTLAAGVLPGAVESVLPADTSRTLDNAVTQSATATSKEVTSINQLVYAGMSSTTAGDANAVPVISGVPAAAVTVGSSYVFQPAAVDADGDTLVFSISGKPRWASFNTATGRLGGSPAASDAGTYGNIVIAVTDGSDSAALAPFSIRVDAPAGQTGSFSLSWSAPVARADGSSLSLSDINGFRIYYGTSPGNYTAAYDVTNGSAQSATVSNLPVGTYYVVMTTYDNAGLESGYSAEIVKSAL